MVYDFKLMVTKQIRKAVDLFDVLEESLRLFAHCESHGPYIIGITAMYDI